MDPGPGPASWTLSLRTCCLLRTGADMTDAAVLRCSNGAAICFSGAASVPGNAHADVNNENVHSVGKHISIRIFGSDGLLTYEGDDQRPTSGKLVVTRRDGGAPRVVDGFLFENYEPDGTRAAICAKYKECWGRATPSPILTPRPMMTRGRLWAGEP